MTLVIFGGLLTLIGFGLLLAALIVSEETKKLSDNAITMLEEAQRLHNEAGRIHNDTMEIQATWPVVRDSS